MHRRKPSSRKFLPPHCRAERPARPFDRLPSWIGLPRQPSPQWSQAATPSFRHRKCAPCAASVRRQQCGKESFKTKTGLPVRGRGRALRAPGQCFIGKNSGSTMYLSIGSTNMGVEVGRAGRNKFVCSGDTRNERLLLTGIGIRESRKAGEGCVRVTAANSRLALTYPRGPRQT